MLTLHLTLRINRIMKLVDVTKDCMDQYHRLHDRKLSRELFLNKLWHLHYLQYRYYRLGFLESDLYKLWLQNRHKEYFGHGTDLEQKCWHDACKTILDRGFIDFVNVLLHSNVVDDILLERTLEHALPFWKRWFFNPGGAFIVLEVGLAAVVVFLASYAWGLSQRAQPDTARPDIWPHSIACREANRTPVAPFHTNALVLFQPVDPISQAPWIGNFPNVASGSKPI
jgi:hypothetical protein